MCLNMLKNEMALKASIKHKRAKCAMDCEYLLKGLTSLIDGMFMNSPWCVCVNFVFVFLGTL